MRGRGGMGGGGIPIGGIGGGAGLLLLLLVVLLNGGLPGGGSSGGACGGGSAQASDVTINESSLQQKISGFGVSTAWGGNFNDPVSLDIEPGGFQIDKDKLRHACFRLLGSYGVSKLR